MQPPIQELHNFDPHLWVYDKAKMLAESNHPASTAGKLNLRCSKGMEQSFGP